MERQILLKIAGCFSEGSSDKNCHDLGR
jgi:hypothetical protein